MFDTIIIGAGSAGYPAGMYASRYNLKNLIIGFQPGGALATSHKVENFPGVISESGGNIMNSFKIQAEKSGSEIIQDEVSEITKIKDFNFKVQTSSGKEFETKTILLATGSGYKKLGVKGEQEFLGAGVSYCATCDGMFFKNKEIVMVGGGDSAFSEALYLSEICSKVTLLVRNNIKAEKVWQDKVNQKSNIIIKQGIIKEIKGKFGVEEIVLETQEIIPVSGVFIAIGSTPNTQLVDKLNIQKDEQGFVIVDKRQETSIKGIYAAGDVTTGSNKFQQTIMSAAEGCLAANSIHHDLTLL